MDLGDFPQYVLMFGAGVWAARNGWLQALPRPLAIRWFMAIVPLGAIAWVAILREAVVSDNRAALSGAALAERGIQHVGVVTCVAVCMGLLATSREKLNTQGKVRKILSDNAFAVYVFHPPILILIVRAMVGLHSPPLVEALMLTGLAATVSFASSSLVSADSFAAEHTLSGRKLPQALRWPRRISERERQLIHQNLIFPRNL